MDQDTWKYGRVSGVMNVLFTAHNNQDNQNMGVLMICELFINTHLHKLHCNIDIFIVFDCFNWEVLQYT